MKIAFIGCVRFSSLALKSLISHPDAELVGVITRSASPINSDFEDLSPIAKNAGIPILLVEGNQQKNMFRQLQSWQPDVVYCFGWSYLLDKTLLKLPPKGVIGFHPAALPQNRGRHPIIWALALGLEETASSFFQMTDEADAGPLISQEPVEIVRSDDAGSLYARISETALRQLMDMTRELATGTATMIPQDHSKANHWRKRGPVDGLIDWRMPAEGIVNLVRALAPPYPGADCTYHDKKVKIWTAQAIANTRSNLEPGRVLAVEAANVVVKCGDGAVALIEHDFQPLPAVGSYL